MTYYYFKENEVIPLNTPLEYLHPTRSWQEFVLPTWRDNIWSKDDWYEVRMSKFKIGDRVKIKPKSFVSHSYKNPTEILIVDGYRTIWGNHNPHFTNGFSCHDDYLELVEESVIL